MDYLDLAATLDETTGTFSDMAEALISIIDGDAANDIRLCASDARSALSQARRLVRDAAQRLEAIARMEGHPNAFECFTIATVGAQLESFMGFGSRILHRNDETGFAVVGMLLDHEQWQRERLGSGSLGGWNTYELFQDALAAANDPYGGTWCIVDAEGNPRLRHVRPAPR